MILPPLWITRRKAALVLTLAAFFVAASLLPGCPQAGSSAPAPGAALFLSQAQATPRQQPPAADATTRGTAWVPPVKPALGACGRPLCLWLVVGPGCDRCPDLAEALAGAQGLNTTGWHDIAHLERLDTRHPKAAARISQATAWGRIEPIQAFPTLLVLAEGREVARLQDFTDSDWVYLALHGLVLELMDRGLSLDR